MSSRFTVNIKGRCNTVVVGDNVVVSQTYHGDGGARVSQVVGFGMPTEAAEAVQKRWALKRKLWDGIHRLIALADALPENDWDNYLAAYERIDRLWEVYHKI